MDEKKRVLISILEWKASFRSGRERCVNNLLIFTDPRHLPHHTHPPLFTYIDLALINSPSKIPKLWTSAKSQNLQVFTSSLNSNEFLAIWLPGRWLEPRRARSSSGTGVCADKGERIPLLPLQPGRRLPGGGTRPRGELGPSASPVHSVPSGSGPASGRSL